jgi:hypothetical protein
MRIDGMRETGMTTLLDPQSSRKYTMLTKKALKGDVGTDAKEMKTMSNTIMTKINQMLTEQTDDGFLSRVSLPRLPVSHRPVVMVHKAGGKAFIAENDSHCKESNFGYSRNKFGGFYNH